MAGSTTRTSRTTDCRRHDAGNTTGGAERPWRAPTHGSTHVSTGHVAEGGTSIACTMTRGSLRWERHIAPKTHRLMRALQQRQGEAAPTEGAAAEQHEERAAEQTVTAGTGAGMGPHTVGNGATAGVGQPSVEGQGRKRKATTGLRTTDIRRRADGQRSGGAVGGVVGGNGAAGTGDAGEKEEEAPQADRQTQLPTHPTQTTASYGSGSSSSSRTQRGT